MNKYKVNIITTHSYIIDVLSDSKEQAEKIALEHFNVLESQGMEHYNESDDVEKRARITFDVTETDDPFSPIN